VRTLTGGHNMTGHTDAVLSVAFSPDARTLASGNADNTIKLWGVASGQLLRTLTGYTDSVYSIAYSADGRTLASGSDDKTIKLWDVASGQLLRTVTLTGHTGYVGSVAYSPDGRTLASGSRDSTIKLWESSSGVLLRTLTGHTNWIDSVVFSPDGRTLASGSDDYTIKLGRIERERSEQVSSGGLVSAPLKFSPQFHASQGAGCMWSCKIFGSHRTKLFHVKRFCPIAGSNRSNLMYKTSCRQPLFSAAVFFLGKRSPPC
jgi:WD40 repeat protein